MHMHVISLRQARHIGYAMLIFLSRFARSTPVCRRSRFVIAAAYATPIAAADASADACRLPHTPPPPLIHCLMLR